MALAPVQPGGCVALGPLWKSEWQLRRSPVRMVVTLVTWAAEPSTRLDHGLGAVISLLIVVTLVTWAAEPSTPLDHVLGAGVEIGAATSKFSCV